jgi:hypothetical protein
MYKSVYRYRLYRYIRTIVYIVFNCKRTCAHVSQIQASLKRASATARIQPDREARGVLASHSALSEGTHLYVAAPFAVVKVNGFAAAVGTAGGCGRPPTYASL